MSARAAESAWERLTAVVGQETARRSGRKESAEEQAWSSLYLASIKK